MKIFNTISIEISSLCNRKCDWCPVAYNERPDERMSGAVLAKILADLKSIDYAGRVELYIYNEPTRELEHLMAVIALVRHALPRACIMIATNGDYLRSTGTILRLYAAGLNQLLINCYTRGLYARRKHKLVDDLPDSILRDVSVYSNTGANKRIIAIEDKHDPKAFGAGVFSLTNRAGNIVQFRKAVTKPLSRMCVRPFRILNINWKGDAILCCQDYHGRVVAGNVLSHSISDIWNGPVFTKYRKALYAKDRSLPLCSVCDCHAGAYPHNVEKP